LTLGRCTGLGGGRETWSASVHLDCVAHKSPWQAPLSRWECQKFVKIKVVIGSQAMGDVLVMRHTSRDLLDKHKAIQPRASPDVMGSPVEIS